jgi:uncharacterized hydrophobic protein (TIGR00271 family)
MPEASLSGEIAKDEEKLKNVFRPFFLDKKRQEKVYGQIKENAKPDLDFYTMTIFAGIIITLGIIIDSTAVVIGGMLIAPLVWPILALALGITMGRSRLLQSSMFTLLKSILVILIVSVLVGLIVPDLVIENNEYLSRTSPTLFELLIGLAAGFIGAFIIAYPKMGSAIAGVVVAAAIVPPIAIIGLSLAKGDFGAVGGASLLLISNLIAITFAAAILFLISNFRSRSEQAKEKRKSGFRWTMLLLVVIIIPLVLITKQTALEVKQITVVKDVISSSLDNVAISEIKVVEKDGMLTVTVALRSAEKITASQIEAVQNVLVKRLNQAVFMKVNIIPIVAPGQDLFESTPPAVIETDVSTLKPELEAIVEAVEGFIKCPVVLNEKKLTRYYPEEVGCPICPGIISCGDGREFPSQNFNVNSALCDDINFANGAPCVTGAEIEAKVKAEQALEDQVEENN